jgi:hypothetical protein
MAQTSEKNRAKKETPGCKTQSRIGHDESDWGKFSFLERSTKGLADHQVP